MMRLLEIGTAPYITEQAPGITDWYSTNKSGSGAKKLTLGALWDLRGRLRRGDYDLVIYHICAKVRAPWHEYPLLAQGIFQFVLWSFFSFHKVGWHYFHWILCRTAVPLIVIDDQDSPRLTKTESWWLDRCRFWFMRELPPNHLNLFLFMDRRCGDVINVRRQERLSRNFAKIRPFGLGFDPAEIERDLASGPAPEKIYDVFYAGKNHTSTVREQGMEELRALQAGGLRVCIPETRLSRPDFYRACVQSWLVWSPEGQGWDCFRHYEALLAGSVPLINYPTIESLQPLRDGEHCLYYGPERGGLTRAIQAALQDRERLRTISERGRAYALEHHTHRAYVRHVFEVLGLLDAVEPHLAPVAAAPSSSAS
jgi:hypothetical protein